jgi:hypothetical protein
MNDFGSVDDIGLMAIATPTARADDARPHRAAVRRRYLGVVVGLLTLIFGAAFGTPATKEPPRAASQNVQPVSSSCRSRVDCGQPLKGGLRITFTGWACTSGFLARDEATDQIVLVTAGHCLVSAGLPAGWSHAYVKIGQGVRAAFADGSRSDAGDIATSESGPRNMLFGSAPGDVRALTSVRSGDLQPVGTPVCRSGGSSGWACGSVSRVDVDVTLRGAAVRHTWWTNFPSAEGDSGAPVVDGDGRLAGIVIATTPTESVYLTADAVSTALGVRPCLDAGCH